MFNSQNVQKCCWTSEHLPSWATLGFYLPLCLEQALIPRSREGQERQKKGKGKFQQNFSGFNKTLSPSQVKDVSLQDINPWNTRLLLNLNSRYSKGKWSAYMFSNGVHSDFQRYTLEPQISRHLFQHSRYKGSDKTHSKSVSHKYECMTQYIFYKLFQILNIFLLANKKQSKAQTILS